MSTIVATGVYRAAVALAAAGGGAIPVPVDIAFGIGTSVAGPGDTALEGEFFRTALDSATAVGVIMSVAGTLTGENAGENAVTEVGVFSTAGLLIGRRTFNPKELEPETRLEFNLDFQY